MSIIIKDLKKFAELLKENVKNKNILIVSHINPDPDTLGSQIALSYILKNLSNNSLIHLYNRDIKEDRSLFYFLQNFKKIKNYIPRNFFMI
jgi:phosphoesterase RecJ-like protein